MRVGQFHRPGPTQSPAPLTRNADLFVGLGPVSGLASLVRTACLPVHRGTVAVVVAVDSLTVAGAVSALPWLASRTDFPFHPLLRDTRNPPTSKAYRWACQRSGGSAPSAAGPPSGLPPVIAPTTTMTADTALAPMTLVIGGIRSGKSAFAEGLFGADHPSIYLATARVLDDDMKQRVRQHRIRREQGAEWTTLDAPLELPQALDQVSDDRRPLLVDSLGTWVSNLLVEAQDIDHAVASLLESLAARSSGGGPTVLVSDEVGLGGVSGNELTRRFADHLGALNQRVAAQCDRVYLLTAGVPMLIKPGIPAP